MRKTKNRMLLVLGFILQNRHNHTVHLENGKQIRSNKNRKKKYSMDDKSWKVVGRVSKNISEENQQAILKQNMETKNV